MFEPGQKSDPKIWPEYNLLGTRKYKLQYVPQATLSMWIFNIAYALLSMLLKLQNLM